jgi:hypothetical protein
MNTKDFGFVGIRPYGPEDPEHTAIKNEYFRFFKEGLLFSLEAVEFNLHAIQAEIEAIKGEEEDE